jgi:nicotinate-nucleotide adenylyltransferase
VVGADVVASIDTWHEHGALRDLVTLAVVDRPGVEMVDPPPGWRSVRVACNPVDVSSTALRSALESGSRVDGLVPDAVIRCIEDRDLYAKGR